MSYDEATLERVKEGWNRAIANANVKGNWSVEDRFRMFSFFLLGWLQSIDALGEPEAEALRNLTARHNQGE